MHFIYQNIENKQHFFLFEKKTEIILNFNLNKDNLFEEYSERIFKWRRNEW